MNVGGAKMSLTSSYSWTVSLLVTSFLTWNVVSSLLLTCELRGWLPTPVKSFPCGKKRKCSHRRGKKSQTNKQTKLQKHQLA